MYKYNPIRQKKDKILTQHGMMYVGEGKLVVGETIKLRFSGRTWQQYLILSVNISDCETLYTVEEV